VSSSGGGSTTRSEVVAVEQAGERDLGGEVGVAGAAQVLLCAGAVDLGPDQADPCDGPGPQADLGVRS